MTEKEFLNIVLQAAGKHPLNHSDEPSQLNMAWASGERWETMAQVAVHYHLSRRADVTDLDRETPYSAKSRKEADISFKCQNETYAIELKVESPATNQYGGHDLEDAIRMDVEKLTNFKADHRWMVVVAFSPSHRLTLAMAAEWENSLFYDFEEDFAAFLCNVDTYPHGLPFQFSNSIRKADTSG
jgi:hypothetical protein